MEWNQLGGDDMSLNVKQELVGDFIRQRNWLNKRIDELQSEIDKERVEMIDLPKGIEFGDSYISSDKDNVSIGILFNNRKQRLTVNLTNKQYEVSSVNSLQGFEDGATSFVKLRKSDYCLVKSTREECFVSGEVWLGFGRVENLDLNNLTRWKISLNKERYVYVNEYKHIKTNDCEWPNYYRLVKRSEV